MVGICFVQSEHCQETAKHSVNNADISCTQIDLDYGDFLLVNIMYNREETNISALIQ